MSAISACDDADRGQSGGDNGEVAVDIAGDSDADAGAKTNANTGGDLTDDGCSDASKWVYLVDSDGKLVRYYPNETRFEDIGWLNCPATSSLLDPNPSPFSMTVDRDAIAWVIYGNGELFQVDTDDASCKKTEYRSTDGDFERFGMGFVSSSAGSEDDILYIAGTGAEDLFSTAPAKSIVGVLNTETFSTTRVSQKRLPGMAEFTGNADGELWAFLPDTTPASIVQVDRNTADVIQSFDLPEIGTTIPQAWAFAYWGGQFHIFLKALGDNSSQVWVFDPATKTTSKTVSDSGRSIVGAGVSTCAPVLLL